ncbi:MAG: SMR family transporter [Polyangiaceae bacterium]
MDYLFLAIAIVLEVIATSALKATAGFTRLVPSFVALVSYGVSFYLLSLALRSIPVGIAYAIWSGTGVALVTLAAWILFSQRLDLAAFIGMTLIAAGVFTLYFFSKVAVE